MISDKWLQSCFQTTSFQQNKTHYRIEVLSFIHDIQQNQKEIESPQFAKENEEVSSPTFNKIEDIHQEILN